MDNEAQLKYELAEIEFDKRQLLLERRELSVKRRLEQLKPSVDSTKNIASSIEDNADIKNEDRPGNTDMTRVTEQNEPSVEQRADFTATSLNTQGTTTVGPDGITAIKQRQGKVDTEKREARKGARYTQNVTRPQHQTTKVEEPSSQDWMRKRRSLSPEPELQAAVPRKTTESHEDLLAAFSGRPPAHSLYVPVKRKQTAQSDSLFVSSESGTDLETSDSAGRQDSRVKRRRTSQEDEKQPEVPGPMTESQQYDLVEHYTRLLLKHMSAVESSLPAQWFQKPTVVSRMRRTTNGTTHHTLSLLHEEFETTVHTYAKNLHLRRTLVEKLDKFQEAQRHWWPKCQALNTQQERTSFVTKVFQDIVDDKFKEQKLKDAHQINVKD